MKDDLLAVSPRRVDIWIVLLDEARRSGLLADYRAMLAPDERERELRFYFQKDRDRYLVTRASVRCVLSRYAKAPPSSWEFQSTKQGRPHLLESPHFTLAPDFNVSHTNEMVVVAIAFGRRIGVDVESRERTVDEGLERFCLSIEELSAYHALDGAERSRRFLETWTLKESYVKARGDGLSLPLDSFGFRFLEGDQLSLDHGTSRLNHEPRWRFLQFVLPMEHIGAACIERGNDADIGIRAILPLSYEIDMPVQLGRTSI